MQSLPSHLLIIVFTLGLNACATFHPSDPEREYRKAIAAEDYRRAQRFLNKIAEQSGEDAVAARQEKLSRLIDETRQQAIQSIDSLTEQGEWQEAVELMETTVDRLPRDADLIASLEWLEFTRRSLSEELELELAQHTARHLPTEIELLEKLNANGVYKQLVRWRLSQARQTGHKLVAELLACAEQSIREKQFEQASYCLQYVDPLASDRQKKQITAARRVLLARIARQERRERQLQEQLEEKNLQKQQHDLARELALLKEDYHDAVAAGWWQSAREKLDELAKKFPEDSDLEAWQDQLQQVIDDYVARRLRQGQRYYTRGEIARALKVWRRAQQLDPGNEELEAHITRARKFLAKLNQLENE